MRVMTKWLEETRDHVQRDYDRVVPVVADEGTGKSTLMLQLGWLWLDLVGERKQSVGNVMRMIAWDLDQFKEMMGSGEQYRCIIVHDAARVLSRKKAMHGEQIEVEEDLLDARFGNYLVLLGYQDFDVVPTMLATRRAKNMLRLPSRGVVHGYGESGIRERYDDDRWPDPAMKDRFPSLEGKDLWGAFVDEDQRRKQERIAPDEDEESERMGIAELADQVVEDGLDPVLSLHGGHNRLYVDADLIEVEYGVSGRKAKKVAKVLKRDVDIEQEANAA
jgi:hypothetical protein